MDQRISLIYYHQVLSLRYVDRRVLLAVLLALLVEGWMMLSDFHLLWKPPRVPEGAVKVAKVLSVSRQAKARSALQLNWFDLSAGQELFEGDEVATMDRSGATIRFADGQTVRLEPNSFLVLRSAGVEGESALQISLLRGGFQQEGAGAAGRRLEIDVGGRKVVASGATSFKLESGLGDGQPRIADVGGGKVSVTEAGPLGIEIGHPDLSANTVLWGGSQAAALGAEPRPASLVSPAGGAVLVNPGSVRLKWRQNDGAPTPTLVEVSRAPDFGTLEWHVILSGETVAEFSPGHKGRYFWRATRMGSRQAVSATGDFEVRHELRAPVLARPLVERGQVAPPTHPMNAPLLGHPVIHYERERWQPRPARAPAPSEARRLPSLLRSLAAVDAWLFPSARAAAADPTPAGAPAAPAADSPRRFGGGFPRRLGGGFPRRFGGGFKRQALHRRSHLGRGRGRRRV